MGTAMAWSSAIGILMHIFPNNVRIREGAVRRKKVNNFCYALQVAKVMSGTQTCFGLGYMLGK